MLAVRVPFIVAVCLSFACSSDVDGPKSFDAAGCPAEGWWDCDFTSRRTITIDSTDDDLSNFPLLVSLDGADLEGMKDQGADLRFVAEDDSLLDYEVDTWAPGESAQIWVRIPALSAASSTSISMYWGNSAAESSANASDVWSNGFQGVWHLNESPVDTMLDSTGNGNLGSALGMDANAQVPGTIGSSISFDGVDDWIEIADSQSLTMTGEALTLSAWIYMPTAQRSDAGVIVKSDDTDYHYQLGVQSAQFGNFRALTDSQTYLTGYSPLGTSRWYYLTGVYDGAISKVYVNAHLDNTDSQSGQLVPADAPLVIGRRALSDERYFVGRIDEARVASVARSQGWIRAEFLNVTGELVTLGAVENF
jgi:biopolymer transport protein ExbB